MALGLAASLISWAPPAWAKPGDPIGGKLCRDVYPDLKGKPLTDRTKIPGLGSNNQSSLNSTRKFSYENPAEVIRDIAMSADDLLELGSDYKQYDPEKATSEAEFKELWRKRAGARFNKYNEDKASDLEKWKNGEIKKKPSNPLPWKKWLNTYIPNQGNDAKGKAFEKYLVEQLGLLGDDWWCQAGIEGPDGKPINNRRYDFYNPKLKAALDAKAYSGTDRKQVLVDRDVKARTGVDVQQINSRKPTKATAKFLTDNGGRAPAHYQANAEQVNRSAPKKGTPAAKLFTTDPNKPSKGAMPDMVNRTGKIAAEAKSYQDANRQLWRESGPRAAPPPRPGGIDWTSMELRYLADDPKGLNYAFRADDIPGFEDSDEADDDAVAPGYGGLEAAELSSDAFFTWLALPREKFWVNLNPDQPDRVIDKTFAKTDAGRVLLEADIQMKRDNVRLMHPDTPSGKKFWDALKVENHSLCYPGVRFWIEPKPAIVRQHGDELFILDAPLKVSAERMDYDTAPPGGQACHASEATLDYNHRQYLKYVVPEVEKAVNNNAAYADLRRVYTSRVAAEWIRERDWKHPGAFHDIIDSGDISRWPARTEWDPHEVWEEMRKEFTTVQYEVTREYSDGDQTYTITVGVSGGVDFGRSPRDNLKAATFKRDYPQLPGTVTASRNDVVEYGAEADEAFLGGDSLPAQEPPPPTTPPPTTTSPTPTASPTATDAPSDRPTATGRPTTSEPPASSTPKPSRIPTTDPVRPTHRSRDIARPSATTSPDPAGLASTPPAGGDLAQTGGPGLLSVVIGALLVSAGVGILLRRRQR
ncbi:hypothetical protein FOE78_14665 [Microlunatus elymi]|uniref:LPXTG-motif cell wall anchor domain-containing protein n=1 Tax=Microlunatus elymi TaxID=2596828 RepID=A0A516Q0Q3_9ACTN|nr:hypothetical protein [Microlunatus elymi]QDP96997.1 hypothetical protein FOE78_14665 [Microlunatus elymi]